MISWMLLAALVSGAFDGDFPSAVSAGRGGSDPCRAGGGDPGEGNAALAGDVGRMEVGADWTRPLGLAGLDLGGVWARIPLGGWLGTGIRWRSLLAGDVYREDQVALDLGARIGMLRLGGGGRWGRVEVAGKDLGRPMGWATGLVIDPHPQGSVGISWEDPSGLDAGKVPMPWTIRAGANWRADDSGWTARIGGSWREEGAWAWEFGQEWRWEPLDFRLGLRTDPMALCAGLGFSWKGARLDWGMQGESKFGWQHHLGASWGF